MARELTRYEQIFIAELAAAAHAEYRTDSKGRQVRVPTQSNPVTREQIAEALHGVRMVEEDDLLVAIGSGMIRWLIDNDFLRRGVNAGQLLITKKAAARYGLPAFLGSKTFVA